MDYASSPTISLSSHSYGYETPEAMCMDFDSPISENFTVTNP